MEITGKPLTISQLGLCNEGSLLRIIDKRDFHRTTNQVYRVIRNSGGVLVARSAGVSRFYYENYRFEWQAYDVKKEEIETNHD